MGAFKIRTEEPAPNPWFLPQLLRRQPCAFRHGAEFCPGYLWVNFHNPGKRGETAVRAGDHILASHDFGKPANTLGYQFGMLDIVRG